MAEQPVEQPTEQPIRPQAGQPVQQPSAQPDQRLTGQPGQQAAGQPDQRPAEQLTEQLTGHLAGQPDRQPSGQSAEQPSEQPSGQPANPPAGQPAEQPAGQPVAPSAASTPNGRPPNGRPPTVDADLRRLPFGPRPHQPSVVVKADLLPAISVASTAALVGLPLAWIWSRIAPAIPGVLNTAGKPVPLPSPYGYHRFDDLAIFMLMGLAAGLATGVAMWMLRERRGPVILLAGVLGSLVAGWLAMHTGVSFAAGHYALATAPASGSVFNIAPRLESGWVVIAEPLGAALAYGVLAAWNGTNDLGRRIG